MNIRSTLKNKKAFTLIEVMVSITLLSIIVIGFLMAFTTSYVNIFSTGNRDDVRLRAYKKMEELYIKPLSKGAIISKLEADNGKHITNSAILKTMDANYDFNFFISEPKPIFEDASNKRRNLTLVFFYNDGEKNISVTSSIMEGD